MNVLLCYCLAQNLHWKLGRLTPSFGSILMVRIKKYFVRNKTFFVFQDRKLKLSIPVWNGISWNLTKFQLIQLIELKFCKVSRNSFTKSFWKFHLSILKNKKVLFLKKKFFSRCQYKTKKLCLPTQFSGKVLA